MSAGAAPAVGARPWRPAIALHRGLTVDWLGPVKATRPYRAMVQYSTNHLQSGGTGLGLRSWWANRVKMFTSQCRPLITREITEPRRREIDNLSRASSTGRKDHNPSFFLSETLTLHMYGLDDHHQFWGTLLSTARRGQREWSQIACCISCCISRGSRRGREPQAG